MGKLVGGVVWSDAWGVLDGHLPSASHLSTAHVPHRDPSGSPSKFFFPT